MLPVAPHGIGVEPRYCWSLSSFSAAQLSGSSAVFTIFTSLETYTSKQSEPVCPDVALLFPECSLHLSSYGCCFNLSQVCNPIFKTCCSNLINSTLPSRLTLPSLYPPVAFPSLPERHSQYRAARQSCVEQVSAGHHEHISYQQGGEVAHYVGQNNSQHSRNKCTVLVKIVSPQQRYQNACVSLSVQCQG